MILQSSCHNCGKTIRSFSFASDRLELSSFRSFTKMDLKCHKCGQTGKYDINDISAETKLIQVIALAIFPIGTPVILILLWDYIWAIRNVYAIGAIGGLIIIPSTIYITMTKNIEKRQRTFNQNKI